MRARRFLLAAMVAAVSTAPALGVSQTLTYDAQGRLSSATYSDGTLICYAYDAAGNRAGYYVSSSGSCFTPVTHTYTGSFGGPASGTETVPSGASTVTITMWSGGAAGGRDSIDGAGGGGGGCQSIQTVSVQGSNTFSYSAGAATAGRTTNGTGGAGHSSSVSGSVSGGSVSLSTTTNATGGAQSSIDGSGAVCSGGRTANGFGGSIQGGNAGGVGGGAGGTGSGSFAPGQTPGGGGAGVLTGTSGSGAAGQIVFSYH